MRKPIHQGNGLALADSLYSTPEKTTVNLANLTEDSNLIVRPALIPGVEYPVTQREDHLLSLAYDKGYRDAYKTHDIDDSTIQLMREKVEQIRKEKIIEGRIKPASIKERKWRLGI